MTFEKLYKLSAIVLIGMIIIGFASIAGGCARQQLQKQKPLQWDHNYHNPTQLASTHNE